MLSYPWSFLLILYHPFSIPHPPLSFITLCHPVFILGHLCLSSLFRNSPVFFSCFCFFLFDSPSSFLVRCHIFLTFLTFHHNLFSFAILFEAFFASQNHFLFLAFYLFITIISLLFFWMSFSLSFLILFHPLCSFSGPLSYCLATFLTLSYPLSSFLCPLSSFLILYHPFLVL